MKEIRNFQTVSQRRRLEQSKMGQFLGIFFFFSLYLPWTCNNQEKTYLT